MKILLPFLSPIEIFTPSFYSLISLFFVKISGEIIPICYIFYSPTSSRCFELLFVLFSLSRVEKFRLLFSFKFAVPLRLALVRLRTGFFRALP